MRFDYCFSHNFGYGARGIVEFELNGLGGYPSQFYFFCGFPPVAEFVPGEMVIFMYVSPHADLEG